MDNYFSASESFAREIYRKDAVGQVAVHISGQVEPRQVVSALKNFLAEQRKAEKPLPDYQEVYYSGGHGFGINWQGRTLPEITLFSAGEDAVSSIEWAAQDLADCLEKELSGIVLAYEELPVKGSGHK